MGKVKLSSAFTHIAGLAIFLSLPIIFVANLGGYMEDASRLFSIDTLLFISIYVFLFYFHTYFLAPKLFRKQRFTLYFLVIAAMMTALIYIQPFDRLISNRPLNAQSAERENRPPEMGEPYGPRPVFRPEPPRENGRAKRGPKLDILSIFLFALIIAFSISVEFRKRLQEAEQRALKADADKANAELFFLKAQIHPHFLFNTLNNIYSLSASKDEKAPESILKLSNIMRYVTDEVTDDFTSLDNEIAFLTDYIDLQKLRLSKKMNVVMSMPENTRGKIIAPLILMTFIENAFKYGISNHTPAEIKISLNVSDHKIEFFCQNSIFEKLQKGNSRTGIGLQNTRSRLQHLYPGKHLLDINSENGLYTVKLILHE